MVINSVNYTTSTHSSGQARERTVGEQSTPLDLAQNTSKPASAPDPSIDLRASQRTHPSSEPQSAEARSKKQKVEEADVVEAKLQIFNQRSFHASETFLQIQHQDDVGSIIDTFA